MPTDTPPDASAPDTGPPPILTPFGFWAAFIGAWTIYGGLYLSLAAFEGQPLSWAVVAALAAVAATGGPAVPLALKRRELLRPERPLGRTLGLHVVVGLVYATTIMLLAVVLSGLYPSVAEDSLARNPAMLVVAQFINGVFLYAILLGFLMWTESMNRVQESRAAMAREAVLRAQAEAKALRAQFNPHFVFNTLHSLMLLVRADPPAAERAIENVAALIRYATVLQRRGVDTVPLRQELQTTWRYLDLEKLRLAERLRVVWDVDADLEETGVPALSFQTLLENAIKHGLSPRPEGGSVLIRAARDGDEVVLTVKDDGEGADPTVVSAAAGRGLDLLERRLHAVYGQGASLTWLTAPGEGFAVTLRVPAGPAEPVDAGSWLGPTSAVRKGA